MIIEQPHRARLVGTEFRRDRLAPGTVEILQRLDDGAVRHVASISFQEGPIGEVGVNGCQVEDLLEVCRLRLLEFLNPLQPKNFTAIAFSAVRTAQLALEGRTVDRTERGVEGTSAP